MKIQCYECRKFFEDKELFIYTYKGSVSTNWHPYCKKCLVKHKVDIKKL